MTYAIYNEAGDIAGEHRATMQEAEIDGRNYRTGAAVYVWWSNDLGVRKVQLGYCRNGLTCRNEHGVAVAAEESI